MPEVSVERARGTRLVGTTWLGDRDGLPRQAGRFLIAGGTATACHYVLLIGLVEAEILAPVPASCIGYGVAAGLNYVLRRRFVFRSRRPHRQTIPRYLAVVGVGFGLNGMAMELGVALLALPYFVVQVAATGLVVSWNFAAHRLWTFSPTNGRRPSGRMQAERRRSGSVF